MALLAAGGPCRHHSWVPDLSSIPKDEVVWVFQDPLLRLSMISLLPQCSTHRTVLAADVEKFPFRHLRIKRILAELRTAQTTMMPPPLTTPPPSEHHTTCNLHCTTTEITTTKRPPVDLAAINRQIISNIQSLRRMSERLQQQPSTTTTTTMTTSHPAPQPTHNPTPADCSNPPPKITDTTTQMRPSDRLLLQPTTTTLTPSQPPLQQDSPLPQYSPKLQQQQQPVSIENDLLLLRNNMESTQSFTTASSPPAPPDDRAPFPPSEPSQRPLPTAPAISVMPIRSRLERLLNNIHDNPIAPWVPDAVHRRYVLHLSGEQDLPAHHTERDTSTPAVLENIPYDHNNSLVTCYVTSPYNPAFDIHPMKSGYRQKRPPHRVTQTNYITGPYNPALDIHPTPTDQRMTCHQPHTRLPLAPPVKVCAQHKRPP